MVKRQKFYIVCSYWAIIFGISKYRRISERGVLGQSIAICLLPPSLSMCFILACVFDSHMPRVHPKLRLAFNWKIPSFISPGIAMSPLKSFYFSKSTILRHCHEVLSKSMIVFGMSFLYKISLNPWFWAFLNYFSMRVDFTNYFSRSMVSQTFFSRSVDFFNFFFKERGLFQFFFQGVWIFSIFFQGVWLFFNYFSNSTNFLKLFFKDRGCSIFSKNVDFFNFF